MTPFCLNIAPPPLPRSLAIIFRWNAFHPQAFFETSQILPKTEHTFAKTSSFGLTSHVYAVMPWKKTSVINETSHLIQVIRQVELERLLLSPCLQHQLQLLVRVDVDYPCKQLTVMSHQGKSTKYKVFSFLNALRKENSSMILYFGLHMDKRVPLLFQ